MHIINIKEYGTTAIKRSRSIGAAPIHSGRLASRGLEQGFLINAPGSNGFKKLYRFRLAVNLEFEVFSF
jgi:hypothetical protein